MNKIGKRPCRYVFALLLVSCCLALLSPPASAEKSDWKDPSYDFSRVRRVLVCDADFSAAEFSSSMKAHKYAQEYIEYAKKKLGCEVVTYEQFLRRASLMAGVDIEKLQQTDNDRAQALFDEYLPKVVDAWINGKALDWKNDYYIVPERTVWEQRRMDRSYRDAKGVWRTDYYYITVPVTYPAHRVDYSRLNMTFEVYDAKTGQMIFGREDRRDRDGYDEHDGMFERICKSFFGDFGNKLH